MKNRNRLFGRSAFLLCAIASAAQAEPHLSAPEHSYVAFQEDTGHYAVERGWHGEETTFQPFGTAITHFDIDEMDLTPHDDVPDLKARVLVTLTSYDGTYPLATVRVKGKRYTVLPNGTLAPETDHEDVVVWANSSVVTSMYFDEITDVKAIDGFEGGDATLTLSWWFGHEQELDHTVTIEELTETSCENGSYAVYMNGQPAIVEWQDFGGGPIAGLPPVGGGPKGPDPTASCIAHLIGIGYGAVERGVYFPLVLERDDKDAFLTYPDPELPDTFAEWKTQTPYAAPFFDYDITDLPEIPLRPILTELVRTSDGAVIDRARTLFYIQKNPFGVDVLVPMETSVPVAGAFAQLSPHGLNQLQKTHAATLPYPLYASGGQERLSAAAIDTPSRTHSDSGPVGFDLSDTATYWVEENPNPNGKEFAGFLAYKSILKAARDDYDIYKHAVDGCHLLPPFAQVACLFTANTGSCVKTKPKASDFAVKVAALTTFFDPAHSQDALGISDVTNVNLWFDDNQLVASQKLLGIDGFLEGRIDPADVYIEYKTSPINPCQLKPADRHLDTFLSGTEDRHDWLTCKELAFHADDGTFGQPLRYDLAPDATAANEKLDVNLASSVSIALSGINADTTQSGTCGESWMTAFASKAVTNWEGQVELLLGSQWALPPSQNETLERLLSPFALGVESVTQVPLDTPAYSVHPLGTYSLLATIGIAEEEQQDMYAFPPDGLYVPYMTSVSAGYYQHWFCYPSGNQDCDGSTGTHAPRALNGVDPGWQAFDVGVSYTAELINQVLWTQAGRPDALGNDVSPSVLGLTATELVDRANSLGFGDVADALEVLGEPLDIRVYEDGAPFVLVTTGPERLVYVVPNIVVEVVSAPSDASSSVHAILVVDVIDRDFDLELSGEGASHLTASWGAPETPVTTTKLLAGCTDVVGPVPLFQPKPCADRLQQVIASLILEHESGVLLDMITNLPAPQLFDSGGESVAPRHLTNRRRFLSSGSVNLFADLCDPSGTGCEP